MRVLVGYASARGSTREIAEHIARRLGESGLQAEARAMDAKEVEPVDDYDAFVLGSAVYHGAWLPEAVSFVADHRALLAERPLWLFSVGSKDALRGPIGRRRAANYPTPGGIAELHGDLHPREHRILTGVIRHDGRGGLARLYLWVLGTRYGDFRDWPAIDAWAGTIAAALATARQP